MHSFLMQNHNITRQKMIEELEKAIVNNDKQKVADIIACAVNINEENAAWETPLMIAARLARFEIFDMLLDAGADVNFICVTGLNVTMMLIFAGHFEYAEKLIARGATFDFAIDNGDTFLIHCIKNRLTQAVEFCCAHGADVEQCDYEDNSPLYVAASCGMWSIAKCLLQHGASLRSCLHLDAISLCKLKNL